MTNIYLYLEHFDKASIVYYCITRDAKFTEVDSMTFDTISSTHSFIESVLGKINSNKSEKNIQLHIATSDIFPALNSANFSKAFLSKFILQETHSALASSRISDLKTMMDKYWGRTNLKRINHENIT